MERESFIFYKSFYEAIYDLKDDIKLEVFTAIAEYALYGKLPEDLKPVARGMFTLIKPNLDINITRYENGMKGGRRPKKQTPQHAPAAPLQTPDASPAVASFEDEIARLKSDQPWCETICMQFHIDSADLNTRLEAFMLHCMADRPGELHPSIKDAARHFSSWMKKAYTQKSDNNNIPSRPDDYSFRGGFGGQDR